MPLSNLVYLLVHMIGSFSSGLYDKYDLNYIWAINEKLTLGNFFILYKRFAL